LLIPQLYAELDDAEVSRRIEEIRKDLGSRVVILAHHYTSDAVVEHADFRGDSLGLSRQAAAQADAEFIVFCGVHFMAETASILSQPGQTVVIPDLGAGCQMADMAEIVDVEAAWAALSERWGESSLLPITYVNSAASLKAFCGKHGGIVCTSSNAERICRWALDRAEHLLFFPDQNLGTNTALAMGYPDDAIRVWNPSKLDESAAGLREATFVVWRGFCYVHHRFGIEHVQAVRAQHPGIEVIVHPECLPEVVAAADGNGSTAWIIRHVEAAPSGARIAVGTECNLVYRLAKAHPNKLIVPLRDSFCVSMARNNPRNLLQVLESLRDGKPRNVVEVPPETKELARVAVERMLEES
jgi:quinolinate synthase